ncbi:hypothetical protein NQZ68_018971 [Dissostichus eleginoides]|nr:hypothetical protein NQZ68_018971 [Dissostichus eleginoides]
MGERGERWQFQPTIGIVDRRPGQVEDSEGYRVPGGGDIPKGVLAPADASETERSDIRHVPGAKLGIREEGERYAVNFIRESSPSHIRSNAWTGFPDEVYSIAFAFCNGKVSGTVVADKEGYAQLIHKLGLAQCMMGGETVLAPP